MHERCRPLLLKRVIFAVPGQVRTTVGAVVLLGALATAVSTLRMPPTCGSVLERIILDSADKSAAAAKMREQPARRHTAV